MNVERGTEWEIESQTEYKSESVTEWNLKLNLKFRM